LKLKTAVARSCSGLERFGGQEYVLFYVRANRDIYRGLLHFVAYRVLGNPDRADIVVENCLFSGISLCDGNSIARALFPQLVGKDRHRPSSGDTFRGEVFASVGTTGRRRNRKALLSSQ